MQNAYFFTWDGLKKRKRSIIWKSKGAKTWQNKNSEECISLWLKVSAKLDLKQLLKKWTRKKWDGNLCSQVLYFQYEYLYSIWKKWLFQLKGSFSPNLSPVVLLLLSVAAHMTEEICTGHTPAPPMSDFYTLTVTPSSFPPIQKRYTPNQKKKKKKWKRCSWCCYSDNLKSTLFWNKPINKNLLQQFLEHFSHSTYNS